MNISSKLVSDMIVFRKKINKLSIISQQPVTLFSDIPDD